MKPNDALTPRTGGTSVLSARSCRTRWDGPGTIYFWSKKQNRYRAFSNFAVTPFRMASWFDPSVIVEFSSGEHAYQAAKAGTAVEQERIRRARDPLDAKRAGRRMTLPSDWNHARVAVMLAVVRAKFAIPSLGALLLSTDDRVLAEDSPYDAVWGCRDRYRGYTGQNLLGRVLMDVRDELRNDASGDCGAR